MVTLKFRAANTIVQDTDIFLSAICKAVTGETGLEGLLAGTGGLAVFDLSGRQYAHYTY